MSCASSAGSLVQQYKDRTISLDRVTASVRGWIAHAEHGNTYRLRTNLLGDVVL